MKDLKEYLLPVKNSVIRFEDIEDEGKEIAFNWFYQQQKRSNTYNKLINNISNFDDLIDFSDSEGHWEDLCSFIGYETNSNTFTEEILKASGVEVEQVTKGYYEPMGEVESYSPDEEGYEHYAYKIKKASEGNYETLLSIHGEDLFDMIKEDLRIQRYSEYEEGYLIDEWIHSEFTIYELKGDIAERVMYFFASFRYSEISCFEYERRLFILVEQPYYSDGYGEYSVLDTLYNFINAGYLGFDKENLISLNDIYINKNSAIKEFFDRLSISKTKEVIF